MPVEDPKSASATANVPSLKVEVVWADITQVEGDVYAVGHYEQVLPQSAERALDEMISGTTNEQELVLTGLTRRGLLRGTLGEVSFYPWASSVDGERGRLVAVAGMGHVGSFGLMELRRASRNLAWAVSSLPDIRTVCTVLIGAGVGNALTVRDALQGLIMGMADAVAPGVWRAPIRLLRIVERELGRARAIHGHLSEICAAQEVRDHIVLDIDPAGVRTGSGGIVGPQYAMALTVAAAAAAAHGDANLKWDALQQVLSAVQEPTDFSDWARRELGRYGPLDPAALATLAARLSIVVDGGGGGREPAPSRLSFVRDGDAVCAAALTDSTVIPERRVDIDDALLAATAEAMTDPDASRISELSDFFTRLVVPRDFRRLLADSATLVVEVDRETARLPWEMLADHVDGSGDRQLLGLKVRISRQLRTTYSPPPGAERLPQWPLRALVIGDPGDPAQGQALPGARREALEVAKLLAGKGLQVLAMIGAPSSRGPAGGTDEGQGASHGAGQSTGDFASGGTLRIVEAARFDVLMQLMSGEYDLLHYAGHGDFDPDHPELTGWVFQDGLLTSRLLERVDLAPSLVVANACLSARTSNALERGGTTAAARSERDLLPGLADEFFRRGVRNYIGTAWEIDDQGAVEFARRFYDTLIPDAGVMEQGSSATVGDALLAARQLLDKHRDRYGALWSAYQHYGDPQHVLSGPAPFAASDDADDSGRRATAAAAEAEVVERGSAVAAAGSRVDAGVASRESAPMPMPTPAPALVDTGLGAASAGARPRRATTHAAVLIGVKNTMTLPTLNAVYEGVAQMRAWLETQPGFSPEAPGDAMDDEDDAAPPAIVTLTDEHEPVTASTILGCIRELVALGTVTQLIVYFAGHGVNLRFSEYWLLSDAEHNPNEAVNVRGSVDEARYCRIPHVVFLSDACRTPADTITMQAVQGSLIFPTGDTTAVPGCVDVFYASRVGRPALEVRPDASSFRAVYTTALVEGLNGNPPIELVASPRDAARSLVGPWALQHYLRRRVPALLTELNVARGVSQEPDAIITSEPGRAWLGEVQRPATIPATTRSVHVNATGVVAASDVAMTAVRSALGGGHEPATRRATRNGKRASELGDAAPSNGPAAAEFERLLARLPQAVPTGARTTRRTRGRAAPAFTVIGTRVVEAVTTAATVKMGADDGGAIHLPAAEVPATSALVVFEDGRGALLPCLRGYSGVLVYDASAGELASVSYQPSGAGALSLDDQKRLGEVHHLQRTIAAAAAAGVFRLEQASDREALVSRTNALMSLDPSLAVYAAHALHEGQRDEEIREIDRALRQQLSGVSLFDCAMLARSPEPAVPALPLLAQGWALIDSHGVTLPPSLASASFRRYVTSSLWTVFTAEGVALVRKAITAQEIGR